MINEKVPSTNIIVTGNTIVDAVNMNIKIIKNDISLKTKLEQNISKDFIGFLTQKNLLLSLAIEEKIQEKILIRLLKLFYQFQKNTRTLILSFSNTLILMYNQKTF